MPDTVQRRRATAAQWAAANPVLKDYELAVETDTGRLVMGDGVTSYLTLRDAGAYDSPPFEAAASAAAAPWRAPYSQGGTTQLLNIGEQLYAPFVVPRPVKLSGLAGIITTAAASSFIEFSLYDDSGSFGPNNRLATTGALDASTTGVKAATFTELQLGVGHYWLAWLGTGASSVAVELSTSATPDAWQTMPAGTGTAPTVTAGSEGVVAGVTGQTSAPANAVTAGASRKLINSAPYRRAWVAMKVRP